MQQYKPIGIFDSGYGGLTVLKDIKNLMPLYDYIYLGDNARAPYGNRSYETVYEYTLQCVQWFFKQGCELVILACNTASAKALRTIQQQDLQRFGKDKRVLGVIRPTSEIIGSYTNSGTIGILGTTGTVQSNSYVLEIEKFFPELQVFQQDCPMWVPLIENNLHNSEGATFFIREDVQKLLDKSDKIDVVLLGCTHYPLLINQLQSIVGSKVKILSQGNIIATALSAYLKKHSELEASISKNKQITFFTTDDPYTFAEHSEIFYGEKITAFKADLS